MTESFLQKDSAGIHKSHLGCASSPLSRRAQRLLSRHFDGEAGWWGRFRAERLLQSSEHAQEFFGALDESRSIVAQLAREQLSSLQHDQDVAGGREAIWQIICARIEQEEYADRLLAKRGGRDSLASGILSKIFGRDGSMLGSWLRPLSWSASGAVMSAAAVLLVVGPGSGGGLAARVDPQAGSLQLAARETTAPNHLIPSAQMVSNGASNPRGWSQGASVRDVSLNAGGQLSGSQTAPQAGFFSPSDRFSSPSSSPLAETSVPSISEAIAAALAARARRESELGTGAALGTRRGRRSLYEAAIPSFAVGSRADFSTRQAPRAVEVDWMRSDGRVQVFHDPVEQVSFIWVNPSRAMIERNAALPSVDGADLVLGGMLGEDPPAAAFDSGVVGLGARVHSSQASASSAGL